MADTERTVIPLSTARALSHWLGKIMYRLVLVMAFGIVPSWMLSLHLGSYVPLYIVVGAIAVFLTSCIVCVLVFFGWPGNMRRVSFVGERLQVHNGMGRKLLDTPVSDAEVAVGYYFEKGGYVHDHYYSVVCIRGDDLGELTLMCLDASGWSERPTARRRIRFPRGFLASESWQQLVDRLGAKARGAKL